MLLSVVRDVLRLLRPGTTIALNMGWPPIVMSDLYPDSRHENGPHDREAGILGAVLLCRRPS